VPHTSSNVLFVGEDEQQSILHFTVLDDTCKFRTGLLDSIAVIRVDDENKSLGTFRQSGISTWSIQLSDVRGAGSIILSRVNVLRTREVVPPQRPDLVLSANIPHIKFGVLVGDRLNVEADSGYRGDVGIELELVEDS
jgi:hypothetical protein